MQLAIIDYFSMFKKQICALQNVQLLSSKFIRICRYLLSTIVLNNESDRKPNLQTVTWQNVKMPKYRLCQNTQCSYTQCSYTQFISFDHAVRLQIRTQNYKHVFSQLSWWFNPMFGFDNFISSPMGRWGMAMAREAWPNALTKY